jgi:hypothetical protein
MSLFEELGDRAPKPGEGAQTALRRELESRRTRWAHTGYAYRGAGDIILRHGQFWAGRELPDEWAALQGAPNRCFINALTAVQQSGGRLRYVEGVYSTGQSHYTPHAWAIDNAGVVEVTYPTAPTPGALDGHTYMPILPVVHWAYAGVVFSAELVQWHLDRMGLPMMDRPKADATDARPGVDMRELHDWPILKVPYDPNRRELP